MSMFLVICVVLVLTLAESSTVQGVDLKTRWRGNGRQPSNLDSDLAKSLPSHCELAIVGTGWGGVYFGWRLGIELLAMDPANICFFEANGRLGGRIYSVSGLPHMDDLVIDVGGYRFPENDLLPAQLVWDKLLLPTSLYGVCYLDIECYKIADVYGNNAGYTIPIEVMLSELMTKGAQVYWGSVLTAVKADAINSTASVLEFSDLSTNSVTSVQADKTLLNLPGIAIDSLDPTSVIFTDSPPEAVEDLRSINSHVSMKVYANYANAWWYNDLGLMTGEYIDIKATAPLEGKYNDGPTKCVTGYGADGTPIYSGTPVAYGNCTGALLVLYSHFKELTYYTDLMTSLTNPLTVISPDSENSYVLDEVHASLMEYHASVLEEAGIDPKTVAKPMNIFIGNWAVDAPYTPSIGYYDQDHQPQDEGAAKVRKPSPDHEVYVANADYGYNPGWAASSLKMAEKILQAEEAFGYPKPTWLDGKYYVKEIVMRP
mmetsp:Transcript_24075/g.44702  ORF Transcript_24075/g.44702 Transcript_24075/m.44702 type:complete len:486 (-) Transcript_24075:222-1679(-)